MERIQGEIKVGRNRIIQLRDALRAATEDGREVEAIFGRRAKSKAGLHGLVSPRGAAPCLKKRFSLPVKLAVRYRKPPLRVTSWRTNGASRGPATPEKLASAVNCTC